MSEPTRRYELNGLIVEWRKELCCHCRNCVNGLPEVFNDKARPWIDLNQSTPEKIEQQVLQCPTSAISIPDTTH